MIVLAGCGDGHKELKTYTESGERCWLHIFDEPYIMDCDTIGMKVTWSVVWPEERSVSREALRELQCLYFGDSNAESLTDALEAWLEDVDFYDDMETVTEPVAELDEERGYSYLDLRGSCRMDSTLATFTVLTEMFGFGAAHGMHSADFLTVDLETGLPVHLADLVTDTNLLCEAVARAIQDLEVNGGVRDCLFDEFRDVERMPLPRNFVVDSARNGIMVFYGLYEITPYCCGIQEVILPIYWLSKHVPLTPYAKRLFGPGSYLEE